VISGSTTLGGVLVDTYLELWRFKGGPGLSVTIDDDSGPGNESILKNFTISTADTYYLRVRASGSGTGTYRLGVFLANTGANPTTGGVLTTETEANNSHATANNASNAWAEVGDRGTTTGSITAGDTDVIAYKFTSGDLVSVRETAATGLTPRVNLSNSAGTIVTLDDGSTTPTLTIACLYSFRRPASGTYYVSISAAAGTGNFTLDVSLAGSAPLTGSQFDYYAVTLIVGQPVSIGLKNLTTGLPAIALTDAFDVVLAAGFTIATNYDLGAGSTRIKTPVFTGFLMF